MGTLGREAKLIIVRMVVGGRRGTEGGANSSGGGLNVYIAVIVVRNRPSRRVGCVAAHERSKGLAGAISIAVIIWETTAGWTGLKTSPGVSFKKNEAAWWPKELVAYVKSEINSQKIPRKSSKSLIAFRFVVHLQLHEPYTAQQISHPTLHRHLNPYATLQINFSSTPSHSRLRLRCSERGLLRPHRRRRPLLPQTPTTCRPLILTPSTLHTWSRL